MKLVWLMCYLQGSRSPYAMAFSILLAKSLILLNWKRALPSSHHRWIMMLPYNVKLENLRVFFLPIHINSIKMQTQAYAKATGGDITSTAKPRWPIGSLTNRRRQARQPWFPSLHINTEDGVSAYLHPGSSFPKSSVLRLETSFMCTEGFV